MAFQNWILLRVIVCAGRPEQWAFLPHKGLLVAPRVGFQKVPGKHGWGGAPAGGFMASAVVRQPFSSLEYMETENANLLLVVESTQGLSRRESVSARPSWRLPRNTPACAPWSDGTAAATVQRETQALC